MFTCVQGCTYISAICTLACIHMYNISTYNCTTFLFAWWFSEGGGCPLGVLWEFKAPSLDPPLKAGAGIHAYIQATQAREREQTCHGSYVPLLLPRTPRDSLLEEELFGTFLLENDYLCILIAWQRAHRFSILFFCTLTGTFTNSFFLMAFFTIIGSSSLT